MARDDGDWILELVRARLAGLDFITRREVLKKLLENGAFLALLAGGGARILAPASGEAQARRSISREALTTPAPDRDFRNQRTQLAYGTDALVNEMIGEILANLGIATRVGTIVEGFGGVSAACPSYSIDSCVDEAPCSPGHVCGGDAHICDQACTGDICGDNFCGGQACQPTHECGSDMCNGQSDDGSCSGTNSCSRETCQGLACSRNVCGEQACPGNTCSPPSANTCGHQTRIGMAPYWEGMMDPRDFLDRYASEPFVRELRDLFGAGILGEVESMIRNRTTLRGRGLLDPGAPQPPSGRPLGEVLRDLRGVVTPRPPTQPGVPSPAPPTAPGVPTAPTSPPPATPPPGVKPTTPGPPATTPTPITPPRPPTTPTPGAPAPTPPRQPIQ